jgi:hypothetical protein
MSELINDVQTVGASDETAATLSELSELGHIGELSDGYRLGIAVALSFGRVPRSQSRRGRKTMLSVSGLDPDGAIKAAVREIYPEAAGWPYRAAEDLAEQGIAILKERMEGEDISFADLMSRLREANTALDGSTQQPAEAALTSDTTAE